LREDELVFRSSILLFLVQVLSINVLAMEMDPIKILPNDAVQYLAVNFLDPKEVCLARKVNKNWNLIMSSDLIWRVFYYKIWRQTHKDDESQSFMDNFKKQALIPRMSKFLTYSNKINEFLEVLNQRFNDFDTYSNLFVDVINHEQANVSSDLINYHFDNLIADIDDQITQVIATFFYSDLDTVLLSIGDKFKKALKKDIIIIIPSGNEAISISNIWQNNDIHELYPNVIWIGSHDEKNDINNFSNYGPLVDIFASCEYPSLPDQNISSAMMWVAEAIICIRCLRPDLNVKDIRSLLIKSSDDHNGIKILNLKNAKKMVLKWE